jgi:hypothetical protein
MARPAGGKTAEDVRADVADLCHPVIKHDVVCVVRREGALNEILAVLENVRSHSSRVSITRRRPCQQGPDWGETQWTTGRGG